MPRRNPDKDFDIDEFMGEREEKLTAFGRLMLQYYQFLCNDWGVRHIPTTQFASHLGVPQSSMSAWFLGERPPSLSNAIILATNMRPPFNARVLRSLGYPDIPLVYGEDLRFIVARWDSLRPEAKKEIQEIIKNEGRFGKRSGNSDSDSPRKGPDQPDSGVAPVESSTEGSDSAHRN